MRSHAVGFETGIAAVLDYALVLTKISADSRQLATYLACACMRTDANAYFLILLIILLVFIARPAWQYFAKLLYTC